MSEVRLQVSNLLNYTDAARLLGITRATVYAMIKRGELHPMAIADRQYLLKEEVEKVMNSGNDIEKLKEAKEKATSG